jgi:hypothetical protein
MSNLSFINIQECIKSGGKKIEGIIGEIISKELLLFLEGLLQILSSQQVLSPFYEVEQSNKNVMRAKTGYAHCGSISRLLC